MEEDLADEFGFLHSRAALWQLPHGLVYLRWRGGESERGQCLDQPLVTPGGFPAGLPARGWLIAVGDIRSPVGPDPIPHDSEALLDQGGIKNGTRAGEDVTLAVARDASDTKGVMLDHYVSEEDAELKAKADRMYRRICEGLTAEVAEAFGHQASGTEDLERQLREAVAAKDWDRAKRLSGQLAKQGRQAG